MLAEYYHRAGLDTDAYLEQLAAEYAAADNELDATR